MTQEQFTVRVLVPADGMRLTNGETVAEGKVYLGIHDSPENWREVTPEEAERIAEEAERRAEEDAAGASS